MYVEFKADGLNLTKVINHCIKKIAGRSDLDILLGSVFESNSNVLCLTFVNDRSDQEQ